MNVPQDISSSEHMSSPIFHLNSLSMTYTFHASTKSHHGCQTVSANGCELRVMHLLGASQLDQCLPLQPLNSH